MSQKTAFRKWKVKPQETIFAISIYSKESRIKKKNPTNQA